MSALDEETKRNLADPMWRLNNLYSIINESGQLVPFRLNEEQRDFVLSLHTNNLVLKCRQIGMTTLAAILALDQALFNSNFNSVIIAQGLNEATKIFRTKIMVAYDNLPALLRAVTKITSSTTTGLILSNGSSVSVGTSARGTTTQFLHVSEMGIIARRFPEKAREIVTGAFEAVPKGCIKIVESTAAGRQWWFFNTVIEARKSDDVGRKPGVLDWKLHFVPWHVMPKYSVDATGVFLKDADKKYFAELEKKHGIKTTPEQRAWYVSKKATLGDDMTREYPSFTDEAFSVSMEGMIYAQEMRAVRMLGRVGPVGLRQDLPVNTFFDLGVNDATAIWLHQRIGAMNRFVKYFEDHNKGLKHYWDLIEGYRIQHGLKWGKHYLPHDAEARLQGAEVMSRKQILIELGMVENSITIVPRIPDLNTGIALTKRILSDCEFDDAGCVDGLLCLDNYSREWDEKAGAWSDRPRHDHYSNGADAFRQFAQSWASGAQQAPDGHMVGAGQGWGGMSTNRGGY